MTERCAFAAVTRAARALTEVLETETALISAARYEEALALAPSKASLTSAFLLAREAARAAQAGDPIARKDARASLTGLETAVSRNLAALTLARDVAEGLVRLIADASEKTGASGTYGRPNAAQRRAPALALSTRL